jgi:hypothetical protein
MRHSTFRLTLAAAISASTHPCCMSFGNCNVSPAEPAAAIAEKEGLREDAISPLPRHKERGAVSSLNALQDEPYCCIHMFCSSMRLYYIIG